MYQLLLIVGVIFATDPICNTLIKQDFAYLTNSEINYFDLDKYFQGYNLTYELQLPAPQSFDVENPFFIQSESDVPTQGWELKAFDIFTTSSGLWGKSAAVLSNTSQLGFAISLATLNQNNQWDFSFRNDITHQGFRANCFDMRMTGYLRAVVQCQTTDFKTTVFYYIDQNLKLIQSTKFNSIGQIKKGKIQFLRVKDQSYIVSASLSQNYTSSYLIIYHLSQNIISQVFILDSNILGQKVGFYDLSVDRNGLIFLASNLGIHAFNYISSWDISKPQFYQISNIDKIYAFASIHKSHIADVFVAKNSQVFQLEWTAGTPYIKHLYQLPTFEGFQDLQANNQVFMIVSATNTYVYQIGNQKSTNMFADILNNGTLIKLNPDLNTAAAIGKQKVRYYAINPPTLWISKITEDHLVKVKAVSTKDSKSISCEMSFNATLISDIKKIYIRRQLPVNPSIISGSNISFVVSDYFAGQGLQVYAEGQNIDVKRQIFQNMQIKDTLLQNLNFELTFPNDNGYFRVQDSNTTIKIYNCSQKCQSLLQKKKQTQFQIDQVLAKIGSIIVDGEVNYYYAYVSKLDFYTIHFINLKNQIESKIEFDKKDLLKQVFYIQIIADQIAITLMYGNNIQIRTVDLQNFPILEQINSQSLMAQYQYTSLFRPTIVKKYPKQNNVFFVKNIKSIMVFSAGQNVTFYNQINFYGQIQIQDVLSIQDEWDFILNNDYLLIVLLKDQPVIQKYLIRSLTSYKYLSDIIIQPISNVAQLKWQLYGGSNILFVKTGTTYIIYNLNKPEISSIVVKLMNMDFKSYQFMSKQKGFISFYNKSGIAITYEVYGEGKVYLIPKIKDEQDFIQNLKYTMKIMNTYQNKSIEGKLKTVNYQTTIVANERQNSLIDLKRHNDQPYQMSIQDRSWFNGTITQYQFKCYDCNSGIQFSQHINLTQFPLNIKQKVNQYYTYAELKGIMIILTDQALYIVNQNGSFLGPRVPLGLNQGETCPKMALSDDLLFGMIFCKNKQKTQSFFLPFQMQDPQNRNLLQQASILKKVMIDAQYSPSIVYKLEIIDYNIYLLQSDLWGNVEGRIFVYSWNFNQIQFIHIIDRKDFSTTSQTKINDFSLIKFNDSLIIGVTLETVGIGFLQFKIIPNAENTTKIFVKINSTLYDFIENIPQQLENYIVSKSKCLKMQILSKKISNQTFDIQVIVTTSNSAQLRLNLHVDVLQNNLISTGVLIQAYNRLASLQIANWLQVIPMGQSNNMFLVGYRDQNGSFTLSQYPIYQKQESNSVQLIDIQGGQQFVLGQNDLSIGVMRSGNYNKMFINYPDHAGQVSSRFATLSTNLTVHVTKISKQDKQYTLNVTAKNPLKQIVLHGQINFTDDKNQESNNNIIWIIIGVVGGLVLIALAGILFYRYKKNQQKKQSLLEQQEDQI